MPTVFSGGWVYLFILVMAICVVWIFLKLRTIQKEESMDKPVIKVAPIPKIEWDEESGAGQSSLLNQPDALIKQGSYSEALKALEKILEDLSPTDDRELRGLVFFRIGACHSRLAAGGDRLQHLLRAGEALRETVRLFTPIRYRRHYLRALGELSGLYEDLSQSQNPVGNLNQAARTCETGAASARESQMVTEEALFLVRAGNAYRQLAELGTPQVNLRKAADLYEKAEALYSTAGSETVLSGRIKVLKMLGDTMRDLSKYFQQSESLTSAVNTYEKILGILDPADHVTQRASVLADAGGALLELYDLDKNPVHLRQALRYSRDALDGAKGGGSKVLSGLSMAVMADSLTRYAQIKDKVENLNRAVKLYEAALGMIDEGEEPARCEKIRESLAETVGKLNAESGSMHSA